MENCKQQKLFKKVSKELMTYWQRLLEAPADLGGGGGGGGANAAEPKGPPLYCFEISING